MKRLIRELSGWMDYNSCPEWPPIKRNSVVHRHNWQSGPLKKRKEVETKRGGGRGRKGEGVDKGMGGEMRGESTPVPNTESETNPSCPRPATPPCLKEPLAISNSPSADITTSVNSALDSNNLAPSPLHSDSGPCTTSDSTAPSSPQQQLQTKTKAETKSRRICPDSAATLCDGVETGKSTLGRKAGLGLFTTRTFNRNEIVTEFVGWTIDREEALRLRQKREASHIVKVWGLQEYIYGMTDVLAFSGGGSFANDGSSDLGGPGNNVIFFPFYDCGKGKHRLFLKALRDLEASEEILVAYNRDYWVDVGEEDGHDRLPPKISRKIRSAVPSHVALRNRQTALDRAKAARGEKNGGRGSREKPSKNRNRKRATKNISKIKDHNAPATAPKSNNTPSNLHKRAKTALATAAKPTPVTAAKPAPVTAATPTPVTPAKPAPVTAAKPTPVTAAKPAPVTAPTPTSVTAAKPAPGTAARPTPITADAAAVAVKSGNNASSRIQPKHVRARHHSSITSTKTVMLSTTADSAYSEMVHFNWDLQSPDSTAQKPRTPPEPSSAPTPSGNQGRLSCPFSTDSVSFGLKSSPIRRLAPSVLPSCSQKTTTQHSNTRDQLLSGEVNGDVWGTWRSEGCGTAEGESGEEEGRRRRRREGCRGRPVRTKRVSTTMNGNGCGCPDVIEAAPSDTGRLGGTGRGLQVSGRVSKETASGVNKEMGRVRGGEGWECASEGRFVVMIPFQPQPASPSEKWDECSE
eukprot:GHVQ01023414.1.p1 GENE.GHVQ01023414.1~~GHVQ01023414.1.p1  ORF type:complete len:839 (+),score=137.58 GHVQ01023414.1:277-2517(+)